MQKETARLTNGFMRLKKKMLARFWRQNTSYHPFAVSSLYNNAGGLPPPTFLSFSWVGSGKPINSIDFVKLNPCIQETTHKTHTGMMSCLLLYINAYAQ